MIHLAPFQFRLLIVQRFLLHSVHRQMVFSPHTSHLDELLSFTTFKKCWFICSNVLQKRGNTRALIKAAKVKPSFGYMSSSAESTLLLANPILQILCCWVYRQNLLSPGKQLLKGSYCIICLNSFSWKSAKLIRYLMGIARKASSSPSQHSWYISYAAITPLIGHVGTARANTSNLWTYWHNS